MRSSFKISFNIIDNKFNLVDEDYVNALVKWHSQLPIQCIKVNDFSITLTDKTLEDLIEVLNLPNIQDLIKNENLLYIQVFTNEYPIDLSMHHILPLFKPAVEYINLENNIEFNADVNTIINYLMYCEQFPTHYYPLFQVNSEKLAWEALTFAHQSTHKITRAFGLTSFKQIIAQTECDMMFMIDYSAMPCIIKNVQNYINFDLDEGFSFYDENQKDLKLDCLELKQAFECWQETALKGPILTQAMCNYPQKKPEINFGKRKREENDIDELGEMRSKTAPNFEVNPKQESDKKPCLIM